MYQITKAFLRDGNVGKTSILKQKMIAVNPQYCINFCSGVSYFFCLLFGNLLVKAVSCNCKAFSVHYCGA